MHILYRLEHFEFIVIVMRQRQQLLVFECIDPVDDLIICLHPELVR